MPSCSHCAWCGTISSSTKRRTGERQMSCSSVNRDRSIIALSRSGASRALRFVALRRALDRFASGSPLFVRKRREVGESAGSGKMLPAVDRNGLTGEIVASVREEEDDEVLQFLHLAIAPERDRVGPGRR